MKHGIFYATGYNFIKNDPNSGILLQESMKHPNIDRQVLEVGEMTSEEAANKCMLAYVQAIRVPEVGDDPDNVHAFIDENGLAIAFTARWLDGREILVCRGCE